MSPTMASRKARAASRLGAALLCPLLFLVGACADVGEDDEPGSFPIQVPTEVDTTPPPNATGGNATGEPSGGGEETTEESSRVEGVVQDAQGNPVEGVQVTFYPQPRTYGAFYETYTDAGGAYAIDLPEGVYQTFAFYGMPDEGQLIPDGTGYGSSITLPPGTQVNFLWEPYL
ncbi:carboxypeptidase-like regulatory domain-containing protein [Streptomyces griseiscabiei]|uniref:Carboxypeptidase-like regulatory domain-containing protein n=1 Tax=Streptomyces griseiscabiei TaxID=2993540 RepID=A0ABU4L387_9ACTN|nr:carboxypeptidase-like regulatory domain-containing protein [Streptomyces griseiscabiei]MBZ3906144.1 carboxypeptidase regulatory-like domain-containing protein [Streptomyces griseiscabiei]MDX2909780.1 carboxypeptidase-like regulatory domain-containing protein [Streptomyces griseiscabiei]